MLTVEINGKEVRLEKGLSLRQILERFKIPSTATAVALNTEIIPRSEFEKVSVKNGDKVELIRAVAGG